MKSLKKPIMLDIYKIKILKYTKSFIKIKKDYILNNLLFYYVSFIYKCCLDINLNTYLYSILEFSSLDLPKVKKNNYRRKSIILLEVPKIFIYNKNNNKEKKEVFLSKKTKFIEMKNKYDKKAQMFAHKFIIKELEFYNVVQNINYLEKEEEKKDLNINLNTPRNNNNNNKINTIIRTRSILRRKKTKIFDKYVNYSNSSGRSSYSLSVLQKKEFFSKEKSILYKKFRNSINANLLWYKIIGKNNMNRMLPKGSTNMDLATQKEYQTVSRAITLIQSHKFNAELSLGSYDILKTIKIQKNIELILRMLIIEGESVLFNNYFNDKIKKIDKNCQDEEGNTFLILSVKYGMNYITKNLLEKGVDVNIQNLQGNTALHYALNRKNFKMADFLKKFGAAEDIINSKGYTPWEGLGKSIEK